jgi:hypothetical protein
MKVWCQFGDFCGGLAGLLLGSAFYFIPGIGPVIVFGPLVSWIVRALEGAAMVRGLSALGGRAPQHWHSEIQHNGIREGPHI